ncbi:MAG: hypothetical protein J6333_02410, partial [Planctomycetes bacterium]|nr:hypothetical protein [Planctomycetota bacterium]
MRAPARPVFLYPCAKRKENDTAKSKKDAAAAENTSENLWRLLASIQMEKGVDLDMLVESLEAALVSAARKKFPEIEELRVRISREDGKIMLLDGDRPVKELDPAMFGRIAAQTAKQVMIQRFREAE